MVRIVGGRKVTSRMHRAITKSVAKAKAAGVTVSPTYMGVPTAGIAPATDGGGGAAAPTTSEGMTITTVSYKPTAGVTPSIITTREVTAARPAEEMRITTEREILGREAPLKEKAYKKVKRWEERTIGSIYPTGAVYGAEVEKQKKIHKLVKKVKGYPTISPIVAAADVTYSVYLQSKARKAEREMERRRGLYTGRVGIAKEKYVEPYEKELTEYKKELAPYKTGEGYVVPEEAHPYFAKKYRKLVGMEAEAKRVTGIVEKERGELEALEKTAWKPSLTERAITTAGISFGTLPVAAGFQVAKLTIDPKRAAAEAYAGAKETFVTGTTESRVLGGAAIAGSVAGGYVLSGAMAKTKFAQPSLKKPIKTFGVHEPKVKGIYEAKAIVRTKAGMKIPRKWWFAKKYKIEGLGKVRAIKVKKIFVGRTTKETGRVPIEVETQAGRFKLLVPESRALEIAALKGKEGLFLRKSAFLVKTTTLKRPVAAMKTFDIIQKLKVAKGELPAVRTFTLGEMWIKKPLFRPFLKTEKVGTKFKGIKTDVSAVGYGKEVLRITTPEIKYEFWGTIGKQKLLRTWIIKEGKTVAPKAVETKALQLGMHIVRDPVKGWLKPPTLITTFKKITFAKGKKGYGGMIYPTPRRTPSKLDVTIPKRIDYPKLGVGKEAIGLAGKELIKTMKPTSLEKGVGLVGIKERETEIQRPKLTMVPRTQQVPKVIQAPRVIETPKLIEVPEVIQVPRVVQIPKTTQVPKLVQVPKLAQVPRLVRVPKLAQVPQVPSVPTVPTLPFVPMIPSIKRRKEREAAPVSPFRFKKYYTHTLWGLHIGKVLPSIPKGEVFTGMEVRLPARPKTKKKKIKRRR